MRDQAVAKHRRPRKRVVRSASSAGQSRRGPSLRRGLLRIFSLLVYSAVLILAVWLLYYSVESPYFSVRDIPVSGAKLVDAGQVQDAAGVMGSNALTVRTAAIQQAVSRLSAIRDAGAAVSLSGRVAIDVTERTPLVQWQAQEGSFLVDREGVAFSQQPPLGPLTTVREIDGPAMDVGGRVDPAVLASIQTLQEALPARAGIQPEWFDYSNDSGIAVPVSGGPRVVFGDSNDLDSKLAALAAIKEYLDSTKSRADLIDLRFKGRPVYVLAPPAPAKSGQTR
jgi:cell division protein FtsQ